MQSSKQICFVIGNPVAHSLSPAMHNAAYKALGMEGQYSFEAKQVIESELADFVKGKNFNMLAVTIPHKEAISKYLNEIDETASKIGAVNTVINKTGKLIGYNTDCVGAIESLKAKTELTGKRVAVLGSGGSARAIIYGLVNEGCEVTVYGRNNDKATELVRVFGCRVLEWNERNKLEADIIVNTTPLGRNNDELPIDASVIKKGHIVFDVNYNMAGTSLLKAAKEKDAVIVDGLEMLLRQGMKQFELYTGLKAPEQAMRNALQNKSQHVAI